MPKLYASRCYFSPINLVNQLHKPNSFSLSLYMYKQECICASNPSDLGNVLLL